MDKYWVPHADFVYLPCSIEKKSGDTVLFVAEDGTKVTIKTELLPGLELVHGEQLKCVDDICSLSVVSEAAMVHTIRLRYMQKKIYTNVSRILIAMNPFTPLMIYGKEVMDLYASATKGCDEKPHIYGLAQDAMQGLRSGLRDQAVLISGESGAGKTESAKLVLSFVAEALRGKHGGIEEKLLRTNPIMEAFGNAMTVRNNNSSRFGKWLDIHFDSMKMHGVSLSSYLLEVSRVCTQADAERGFHVFFQLLKMRTKNVLDIKSLNLEEPGSYCYLLHGRDVAPGIDDADDFEKVREAFTALKFEVSIQKEIFRILGGILTLGNAEFKDVDDCASLCDAKKAAVAAAEIFKLDSDMLTKCMTHKKIVVGKDTMEKPIRSDQARSIRDSISRLIYGKLFLWLIQRINSSLTLPEAGEAFNPRLLGVLDIAGFESFETNSLEQLLINLSNEHLQQQFNNMVFKTELEDYRKEGVTFANDFEFTDNSDVLELLDSKGSILDLLDEAISLPKCNDMTYSTNVLKAHEKHARIVKPKFAGKAIFGIKHYAGEVMYTCDGFLEKNADRPPDDLPDLLCSSELEVLKGIGTILRESQEAEGSKGPGQKKKAKTVTSGFRTSLRALMSKINSGDPHYIRCIKPNVQKKPDIVTAPMVYQQLLFSGVFDAINIRRQGYSSRMPYKEFVHRYMCIVPGKVRKELTPNTPNFEIRASNLKSLMESLNLPAGSFQIGTSKVLLKQSALSSLELAREIALQKPVELIQACARRRMAVKAVKERKGIQRELQAILKTSSVFDTTYKEKISKEKKRLTITAASPAVERLGSVEAVEEAVAKITPLLEKAEKLGLHNGTVFEATKTRQRMKMELDCIAELQSLTTSIEPVRMEKALIRSRDLGLHQDAISKKVKDRIAALEVQVPLCAAMRGVIQSNATDENQLVNVMAGLAQSGIQDKPEEWLPELGAAQLLEKMDEFWQAKPELWSKKANATAPGQARKTITGCGPVEQARLLHSLTEAAQAYDAEALEALLKDAMNNGLTATDLASAKQVYEEVHTEDFISAKIHELVAITEDPSMTTDMAVFKQLQNLAKQVRKLQGDIDLYNKAADAAQKGLRGRANTMGDADSIFSDLSSFQGLKPSTAANAEVTLSHTIEPIPEALTQVLGELEGKAIKNFRNIMIGMYDRPASDVEVMAARQAVMELACSEPRLRTEIYVQAMKQITKNPKERSVLMGWQLLRFLCQAAPPRQDIFDFVDAFARDALASGLTGVPDQGFLQSAGIPEDQWSAYTVDVSREADDCLAALAQPMSWILASKPNASTVDLQAKEPEQSQDEMIQDQRNRRTDRSERGYLEVDTPVPRPPPANSGSCADRCSNCVLL